MASFSLALGRSCATEDIVKEVCTSRQIILRLAQELGAEMAHDGDLACTADKVDVCAQGNESPGIAEAHVAYRVQQHGLIPGFHVVKFDA
jgi:hypothetical protein